MVNSFQKHGINVSDIQKLKKEGICTVTAVIQATRRNLCKVKGLSETKVEKIKEAASKLQNTSFITAAELERVREQVVRISTGSDELNKLIGGRLIFSTGSCTPYEHVWLTMFHRRAFIRWR
ncbi:MAG: hypothetical protein BJ554DRAFT_292 [Olpidium bornovanus]|uniref:DNA recombination and repair protein Rad51-like C-terminal domain-containing protein n=1 Tax=Olpidium bornovanus TaxID=278681 RepID=A0A8H7ZTY1_9FUNG|nr:MAG: hypothetical protein BJ554DRAFT_292 [Olpidium bornovanus]